MRENLEEAAVIAATLALARKPEERADTFLHYRFAVLPRVGEVISIQLLASPFAKEYRIRRVTWDLVATARPSAIGEAHSVTIECHLIDSNVH